VPGMGCPGSGLTGRGLPHYKVHMPDGLRKLQGGALQRNARRGLVGGDGGDDGRVLALKVCDTGGVHGRYGVCAARGRGSVPRGRALQRVSRQSDKNVPSVPLHSAGSSSLAVGQWLALPASDLRHLQLSQSQVSHSVAAAERKDPL
jgi:hypothetical protein